MKKKWLALLLVALLLLSCTARPAAGPIAGPTVPGAAAVPGVAGHIGNGGYRAQVRDLLNDFARGATVSLIQVNTGDTAGTSLADQNGKFVVQFGGAFVPTRDAPGDTLSTAYCLESVKGIKGSNPTFNQAGASAMRLRTLIWFDFTQDGWVGLTSASPSPITISYSTTAVSFFVNAQLVNGYPETPADYIACLDPRVSAPGDYTPAGDLSATVFGNLLNQVASAVAGDQDPIRNLVLAANGTVVNTGSNLSVTGVSPPSGPIGSTVTITGQGLNPSAVSVLFPGAIGSVDVAASATTSLIVPVPPGARSGRIQVSVNGVTTFTPPYAVTTNDGHLCTFTDTSGNTSLYAGSSDLGTLVRVNPDGSTTTLSAALTTPRSVLVNPEGAASPPFHIYVADAGTGKIVQMSDLGVVQNGTFLAATDPQAVAIGPNGDLFVAQKAANSILRARVNWATGTVTNATVATYTGISSPTALAFDHVGNLYVVQAALGEVQRFTPNSGDTGSFAPDLTWWADVDGPAGIAIDTAGAALVTSPSNNAIYRIDPLRHLTVFLGQTGPQAIGRDAAGNTYFTDQSRNLVRRLTPAGDQRIVAYGLAGLSGIAADGSGNVYAALNTSGAILELSADGVTTAPLIAGISAPYGLRFRNGNLYVAQTDTNSVTQVAPNGTATAISPGGLHYPGGVEVSDDGSTYYAGRQSPAATWVYQDTYYYTPPDGSNPRDAAGIDLVTNGGSTVTQTYPLIQAAFGRGFGDQGLTDLGTGTGNFALVDQRAKKIYTMTTLGGVTGSQLLSDVTPSFGGTRQFPAGIFDVVYDGSQYVYVSCGNGYIYRLDKTTFSGDTSVAAIGPFPAGGYPYGLTMMSGDLYAVDRGQKTVRRIVNPTTATTYDATWTPTGWQGGTDLRDIANTGGQLFVTDFGGSRIYKLSAANSWNPAVYTTLPGQPDAIYGYSNGNLLVMTNSGHDQYTVVGGSPVTLQVVTQWCCGWLPFLDANGNVFVSAPYPQNYVYANGLLNTYSLARDGTAPSGNWLYVADSFGVYGFNLTNGDGLSLAGMDGPCRGVSVNPTTHDLYVLSKSGKFYQVDPTNRTPINRANLPTGGWGLDYDSSANKIYAAGAGNGFVYRIDPANSWNLTTVKMGLHAPSF